MLHVSMGYCIRLAYGVQRSYELVGPGWIDPPTDVLVDIVAKTGSPAAEDQVRLMLQTLLADRFRLAVHREKRDIPAYALVLVRSERALQQSGSGTETKVRPGPKPYDLVFQGVSIAQLALQLGPPMTSRPVVDKTGLQGSFDFTLELNRYIVDAETGKAVVDARGAVDMEGAVLQGVRDQLGLALKADRAPVEVLVIDHVEKTPSAN